MPSSRADGHVSKFYITTPIYYVNDKPHIGHAYTTIVADILARWHRLKGDDVFFLTGTDEHGEKIEAKAREAGKEPREFVDEIVKKYYEVWKTLGITYDKFIRTSDEKHERIVKEFIKKIYDAGDIYEGEYEGWYCIYDESFFTDLQLKDGKCPECGREVKKVREKSYFFRLSKYQERLLELYKANPKFLSPEFRSAEIINRVKEGLNDVSITRKSIKWGVKFPIDESYTVYVWVDALTNYISALGWPDGEFSRFWPADVHLVGKEINWFHSVIWPALLMSAGIEPPRMVFAHGWWTVNGQKMSKSLKNTIDPVEISKEYGVDQFRYALVREMPLGDDGDFSKERLVARINGELVAELGNLVYRVLSLGEKFEGKIEGKPELEKYLNVERIDALMENLDLFNALDEIFRFIRQTNRYINDKEPWKLRGAELGNFLYNTLEAIRVISILISPFMPETSEKIDSQIGVSGQRLSECRFMDHFYGKISKGPYLFSKVSQS
ncbi:MAG: methionine--tRNA ligase [Candidatus Micrarchaeaceae archaeon]